MQHHTFDGLPELREVSEKLARASRHPVYADLGSHVADDEAPGSGIKEPERLQKYAMFNSRDNEMVYFGSDRYNLIQHREVIDSIVTAVENTEGSIEKGVIHDYGAKIDGVLVFGDQDKANIDVTDLVDTDGDGWRDGYVPPEGADWVQDRLGLGMRFQNSFDGRTKVGGSTMGYRFICGNWMVWGEETIATEEAMHLKAGGEEIGIDPAFFEDIILEVFDKREMLEPAVEAAVNETFPLSWAPDILQRAGFGKQYAREIAHELGKMQGTSNGETSLWHLYNAATTHIDHNKSEDIGPTVYQRHHETAWNVLGIEPEEPEEPVNLTAFARAP